MDKKKQEMIMAIAKEYGFDTFERIPDWKGYEVYSPYNKNSKMPFIGQPVFILVKQGQARVATEEEWGQFIENLPD